MNDAIALTLPYSNSKLYIDAHGSVSSCNQRYIANNSNNRSNENDHKTESNINLATHKSNNNKKPCHFRRAHRCRHTLVNSMGAGGEARSPRRASLLPRALDELSSIQRDVHLRNRTPVFFLDYDGTLTPIVPNPDDALLSDQTKLALEILAKKYTTAIITGRALAKIKAFIGLDSLFYAGSHGFDIEGPSGVFAHRVADDCRPDLECAKQQLRNIVQAYPGATLEDNFLSVSVHYRHVPQSHVPPLQQDVERVATELGLRFTNGKKVWELRPNLDWHKGKAVEYLLEKLSLNGPEILPVYIGDDITDEDAFQTLTKHEGLCVIVASDNVQRTTHAALRLSNPQEVRTFLQHFTHAYSSAAGVDE